MLDTVMVLAETHEKVMPGAVRVKPKVHWRPREVGDSENVDGRGRRTTVGEQSQCRESTSGLQHTKAIGVGLPKDSGARISTQPVLSIALVATGVNVCSTGFWFCFELIFSISLLLFGMGRSTLCYCRLDIVNFVFDFSKGLPFALSLSGEFELGLFSKDGAIKTSETLRDGLNSCGLTIGT